MKIIIGILFFLSLCHPMSTTAQTNSEEQLQKVLKTQMEEIHLGMSVKQLDTAIQSNNPIGDISFQEILERIIQGDLTIDYSFLFSKIIQLIIGEFQQHLKQITFVLTILLLLAMAKQMKVNFISGQVLELATAIAIIAMGSTIFTSVLKTLQYMESSVAKIVQLIQLSFPMLLTLLVSTGNIVQASVFRPIIFFTLQISVFLIQNIIIPWLLASLIFAFVGRVGTQVQMTKISGFLRSVCGWIIGFIFTLFIGIVSLQGTIGKTIDSNIAKTMKFAVGSFIPVIGKFLAESYDMVIGCATILKQSFGIALLIAIVSVCMLPLIQLFVLFLMYKIIAVISEPIADQRFVGVFEDTSMILLYAFASFTVIILLFYFLVTTIALASQMSLMPK